MSRPWLPADEQRVTARPPARLLAGTVAALFSIAVHVLLIEGVLLAEGGRVKRAPHEEGLGANAIAADAEPIATMILIEEPGVGSPEQDPLELVASHGRVLQNLRLTIVSPEPTLDLSLAENDEADESKEATPADAAGDRQARAELFGRYLGQIQARVERAWWRPRTPIGDESFECDLQVTQNTRGEVLEVALQHCNGDIRWQVSLVRAIEQASPLPAPPDPKVFAESLRLSFTSRGYEPGADEQGFEPIGLVAAARAPNTDAPILSPPSLPQGDDNTNTNP